TRLNADAGESGPSGPRVVEAYTPLYSAQSTRPIGVLEVYLPYAPIAADLSRGEAILGLTLIVGLLVLWVALLGVSASATRRLRGLLTDPAVIDGLPLTVEASVGFALAPDDGADIGTLLTHADVAMYVAKRQHHGVVHYQPEHDQYDASTLALIGELGAAIRNEQLVLHFQPKADVRSGRFTAVEALVRW